LGDGARRPPFFFYFTREELQMTRAWTVTAALALTAVLSATSNAETIVKKGKTSSGDNCTVSVEKHADGSISAAGASSGSSSSGAGAISSSSSAGSTGVHVQAGGGSVSSSSTVGGPGSVAASTITVNGCTISTSSP
jgi:hypothetical protein